MSAATPTAVGAGAGASAGDSDASRSGGVVMRGLRLLRIEVRRSVLLWLVPLLGFAAAYAGKDYSTSFDTVPTWLYTSAGIGWSTIFLGPMVAGVACWAAGRDARRGVGDLLTTTATSATRRELVGWGAAAVLGLAAYALLGVCLTTLIDGWGAWGRPEPGLLLVGAAVVLLAVSVGYVVGTLLPWRLLPPLVGIGVYLLLLFQEDSRFWEWQQLGPATWLRPSDYSVLYRPTQVPLTDLLLWLGGLSIAVLALLGLRRREWFSAVVLVVGVALAVTGAAQLLDAGAAYGYRAEHVATFTPTCVSEPFPLCSHPAYAELLPENAALVARLLEPVQGIAGVPLRIEQRGHGNGFTPDGTGTLLVQWIGRDPSQLARTVAQELTQASDRPVSEAAWEAQLVVAAWLMQRLDYDVSWMLVGREPGGDNALAQAALERFAALDVTTQRTWLEANLTALRNGEISLEELP